MANKTDKIIIPVGFETKPQEEISLIAFLFTRSGKLLEKKNVEGNRVEFGTSGKELNALRVFLAPAKDSRIQQATSIDELQAFRPYEPVLGLDAKGKLDILPIPDYVSKWWRWRFCRITGKVTKTFTIDGITQDRGICHARVHICEVDRIWWWIERIPDWVIKKIPDIVLQPHWPIPVPDPGPERIPDLFPPGPVLPVVQPGFALNFSGVSEMATPEPLLAAENIQSLAGQSTANLSANISQVKSAMDTNADLRSQLLSGNVASIRNAVATYFHLFHPIFCYIPWIWPYFYRCDEIAVVYTDINGRFDTTYLYWDDGDQPDLYFWVEYLIDGVWTTVYKPPIPCYTYWNYACGSEVNIKVTDDRVRWYCNDVVDGDIVWIKSIGHAASVTHIQQTNLWSVIQGKWFNRIGLSDVSVWASPNPVGDFRRPFGSNLYFLVQFGSGLPSNGMYYYRWSYKKLKNADLSSVSDTYHSLHQGQALYKSYTYEFYDILMHKHIGSHAFKLGPNSKGGNDDLFIIPPVYPTMAPVNATEMSPQWDQNTATVVFDSTQFSDGLYEFLMEFFDKNGNKITAFPKELMQVPDYNTFAPSVDAPNQYLVLNGAVKADAFRMVVRIDNQKCDAQVYKIKVDGVESSTNCCGFVKYQPASNIEIAFRAYHPYNFADFSFAVQKGTCSDPAQYNATYAAGMVIGDADGYARDSSSIYRKIFSPATLLGICNTEGKAAFAESLGVSALATNGNNQLYFLDASALAAFALEP